MQKHKNTNIHLLIVLLILVALPLSSYSRYDDDYPEKYAVIFDAGSTGSRVHVFRFNPNMELLNIANDGIHAAANSLKPLLEKAEVVVPKNLHTQTPIKIGSATAGLRLLKGDASEKILQAVRDLLKNETSLSYKDEWVSVLEGNQEGSYFWVALNYLYGNLGKNYSGTIATIDLGGYYTCNGVAYKAAAQKHGPSVRRCKAIIRHHNCSFAGVWNGGGGAGTTNLHVSSFFYDFASVVGIVDPKEPSGISQAIQYYKAAKLACQTKKQNMKLVFPSIGDRDIPFICRDLTYEYTLLVDGFVIDPYRKTTFVHQVKYLVEAAWPLGSAIDVVSSTT
ncbi:Apyrase [Capsicum annuum]|uniref:Apyrase n=1 Tax=Capsicum annuum TaxID=4072 RepID=A0A2G3A9F7_CAPAN|nr:Apyrase [Capsicum annuum]